MNTPIFAALAAEHPDVLAAMTRPAWSYADALAAADAAIAARAKPARKRKAAKA
jgi:hypothetical protein